MYDVADFTDFVECEQSNVEAREACWSSII